MGTTNKQKEDWRKYAGKMPVCEIAEMLGVEESTIRYYATLEGVSLQFAKKRWKDDEDEFLQENAGKLSIKEIASKLNRTERAISERAGKIGVSLARINQENSRQKYTAEDERLVILMLEDGELSRDLIAKKMEVSLSFVNRMARKLKAN